MDDRGAKTGERHGASEDEAMRIGSNHLYDSSVYIFPFFTCPSFHNQSFPLSLIVIPSPLPQLPCRHDKLCTARRASDILHFPLQQDLSPHRLIHLRHHPHLLRTEHILVRSVQREVPRIRLALLPSIGVDDVRTPETRSRFGFDIRCIEVLEAMQGVEANLSAVVPAWMDEGGDSWEGVVEVDDVAARTQ